MGQVPALDGLRAVAILMVVGYHIDKSVVPAGHWGVTVFFVLSGCLITGSLCAEVDRTGRVGLGSFYLKRGVRLVPALLVVCLALLAVGTDWFRVVPAIGFYANYARIEGLHLERLTHTWFIAVIAHFYLLWPLVIAALPARHRLRAIGALTLAAIAWRVIAIGVMSPGWVYNATDTNIAALLAGSFLGVARPRAWRFAGWSVPALLGLMLLPVFGDQGRAVLWGGFVALALGAIAVQYAVTRPTWLESQVLVQLAKVSYGLYLWHYVFLRSDIPVWAALLLTIVATAASWYLVERPLVRWAAKLTDSGRTPRPARRSSPAEP